MEDLIIFLSGIVGTFMGIIIFLKYGVKDTISDNLLPILFISLGWPVMLPMCFVIFLVVFIKDSL